MEYTLPQCCCVNSSGMSTPPNGPVRCYTHKTGVVPLVTWTELKHTVFWDVTPCGSCDNRSFGGTYRLYHQGDKNQRARNNVSSNLQPKHAAKKYYVRAVKTSNLT
jgi:hypothetical protein